MSLRLERGTSQWLTNVSGGRRIRLNLEDFVHDDGCHRWMFLSGESVTTVRDLVDKLRPGVNILPKMRTKPAQKMPVMRLMIIHFFL